MILTAVLTSGCYLLSQSVTFLGDRIAARPVEKVLTDPGLTEETRTFLLDVEQIADYGERVLGLERSKNYTTYLELERDHLAYVVYAADELSFDQHTWSFPITGSIPYKGYYSLSSARREAGKLQNKQMDTWISVVDGFSSLGFFTDPLYSFMAEYSPHRLSKLIIHEMVHATVWVKNHSSFNEQLASFIAEKGAETFVHDYYGPESQEYRSISLSEADRKRFLEWVFSLRSELERLYHDSSLSDEKKRREKAEIIEAAAARLAADYDEDYLTERYRSIPELPINNAFIAIYGVYHASDDLLERLYTACGEDTVRMLEVLKPLDGSKRDPRLFIEQQLEAMSG